MSHDILKDTWVFQEVMKEGREEGREEGMEKGKKRGAYTICRDPFSYIAHIGKVGSGAGKVGGAA